MDAYDYAMLVVNLAIEIVMILVFWYALSKSHWYKIQSDKKSTLASELVMAAMFGFLGILATEYFCIDYNTAKVNIRDVPVMIAGMLGGPVAGIGAGLIAGGERFLSGGITAVPCSISTMLSAIIGSALWYFSGKRFPDVSAAGLGMVFLEVIDQACVWFLTEDGQGPDMVRDLAFVMIFINTIGIIAFAYVYDNWFHRNDGNSII
jgi:sigma-B regulation protein RsbU (phosphoserine phosphatase)